jgi:outer membrane protein assembly factor BamE (lipoprotein component of BamABCDE complex)
MRRIPLVAILLAATAGSANSQASQAAIDPGMTREQVIARLGKPASEHSNGSSIFLYYRNGQEKKMGMSDLVAIEDGKVVDAVFRSSARKYTGRSSSPAPVSAEAAIAKGNGGKAPVKKAAAPVKKAPAPVKKAADVKKAPATGKAADTKKVPETKKTTPAPTKKP